MEMADSDAVGKTEDTSHFLVTIPLTAARGLKSVK
jgi:hypothetical protein